MLVVAERHDRRELVRLPLVRNVYDGRHGSGAAQLVRPPAAARVAVAPVPGASAGSSSPHVSHVIASTIRPPSATDSTR